MRRGGSAAEDAELGPEGRTEQDSSPKLRFGDETR
jgi:hypothetical protein